MLGNTTARAIGTEMLAFMLAATCAGCDRPESLLCDECRERLSPTPLELRTPRGLRVRAALPFELVAARCLRRLKDDGETMIARPLGTTLRAVLGDEVGRVRATWGGQALVVPMPTSRAAFRRRGYRVPDLLIRRAGEEPSRLLRPGRRSADQRGLGAGARAENVRDTMRASAAGCGRAVVLVDDVVTTGASFDEAARALGTAGFEVVSGVALAATPRHSERNVNASGTRRK